VPLLLHCFTDSVPSGQLHSTCAAGMQLSGSLGGATPHPATKTTNDASTTLMGDIRLASCILPSTSRICDRFTGVEHGSCHALPCSGVTRDLAPDMQPSVGTMRSRLQARHLVRLFGPCALLLAACQATTPPTIVAPPSSQAALSADAAASEIANARCDHEVACGAVGVGRAYAARDQCASELRQSAKADLAIQACPTGIAARFVDDCTGKLRKESCHPLSTLSRMYACRPAALCLQMTRTFTTEEIYGE
jgi:hypothetical protein